MTWIWCLIVSKISLVQGKEGQNIIMHQTKDLFVVSDSFFFSFPFFFFFSFFLFFFPNKFYLYHWFHCERYARCSHSDAGEGKQPTWMECRCTRRALRWVQDQAVLWGKKKKEEERKKYISNSPSLAEAYTQMGVADHSNLMLGLRGEQWDLLYLAVFVHLLKHSLCVSVWLEEAKDKGSSCCCDMNGYN